MYAHVDTIFIAYRHNCRKEVTPVSYTHLDVYKRQGWDKEAYTNGKIWQVATLRPGKYRLEVTYAYTDVYKRQLLW